jgi:DNA-binding GntR family transcriptional regulator
MSKSVQPIAGSIARALEKRIIEGLHTQAVPLRQAELAAEFGASHIPVREALAMLAEKGMVRIVPNRGAMTVPLSASHCRELAEMRVALEVIALRHSVPRLTQGRLAEAKSALDAGRRARTLTRRARCNWDFHRALYAQAERPFLLDQMESLWRHADRYLRFAWSKAHHEWRSDQEHDGIFEACAAHDVKLACRLTREHIIAAASSAQTLLEQEAVSEASAPSPRQTW